MMTKATKERHTFEIMLLIATLGMTVLLYRMGPYKIVVLNLYFLPIVLSGYFLGRTSAGILALFCTLCVTLATTWNASGFASFSSPVMMGLALTVWAGALGLTAILVGTLCDERAAKVKELHEAYVGVVEVVSKYLQSGNPKVKTRSIRIAEMCQMVGEEMRLSRRQVDDIRVGALLHDLGSVEITTKVISKAVDMLETTPERQGQQGIHTFLGLDLVHSLGSVLNGAIPLLGGKDDAAGGLIDGEEDEVSVEVPLGARIIVAVRALDALTAGSTDDPTAATVPMQALRRLRKEYSEEVGEEVLGAVERVVRRTAPSAKARPALV